MNQSILWPPPHTFRRSKRARRISLRILPGRGLEIVLPTRPLPGASSLIPFLSVGPVIADERMGLELLERHRAWVLRNLDKFCGVNGPAGQGCPGIPNFQNLDDPAGQDHSTQPVGRILPERLLLHGGLLELHLEWAHRALHLPGPRELLGALAESGGLLAPVPEDGLSAPADALLASAAGDGLPVPADALLASAPGDDPPMPDGIPKLYALCRLKDGDEEQKRDRLRLWLRGYAGQYLGARLSRLSALHGLAYSRMRIGWQSSRWGSYSRQGAISLNAKLIFLPPELSDIVLLHELCHSVEMSHNQRFHAVLRHHEPRADELERALNKAWEWLPSW